LNSTVIGLGSVGFISSSQLVSTVTGLEQYISSFIDPQELASTIQRFISVPNLLNLVSTPNLLNLVSTATLLFPGFVSTPNLLNLVSTATLNQPGFVSSPNLLNLVSTATLNQPGFVSTPNLLELVSTSFLTTRLNSTVNSLAPLGFQSTFRSTFLTLSTGLITTSTLVFLDSRNANAPNQVYVRSTFLYFNDYIIGGATQLQPQIFTF
jgi:hypothetical protein